MDDIFSHLNKPMRDFGKFQKPKLKTDSFEFPEAIEIDGLVRTDEDDFMSMTIMEYNNELFELSLIFSAVTLKQMAKDIQLINPDFASFLTSVINSTYCGYEEFEFPTDQILVLLMTGRLSLDMGEELEALGEDFIPFRITSIQACAVEDIGL